MNRLISTLRNTVLATLVALMAVPVVAAAADNYKVDTGHSAVIFSVSHLNIANFYGRFNKFSGTFRFDAANPGNSEVNFEVDAKSVFTADKKRDDHLRGPDFFSAKQFPKITFKSTKVRALGGDKYEVTGKLTLRGVSKTVKINMSKTGEGKDPWGGERIGFEGTLTVNRLDYGVNYMPDGLGKNVKLIIAVEGIKQK